MNLRRAANMAYRVLVRLQATDLPVDPLHVLRLCRDTAVCTYTEAAESMGLSAADFLCRFGDADAFTLRRGSQYIIAYREDGHPARRNFTLAHELAHRLLHHTGASPEEEREADMFASHLLCPRPAIARLARRFQPLYAEQVAAVCYVSLSCARALSAAPPVDIEETLYRQVDAQLAAYVDCVTPTTAQNHLHPLLWRAE